MKISMKQSVPLIPISVIVANSNPFMLSAMSEAFEKDKRFSLVATVSSAESFLSTAMRVSVELGVIEWNLPQLGGQKLIEVMREQASAPRIVVYGDDSNDVPLLAMGSGAAAQVSRNSSVETVLETCADVAAGKMIFPFLDVRQLQSDPISQLSKRERALLASLSNGLTNRELASEFDISINTVKFHLSNLYEKLGIRSRAQAIAFYYGSHTPKTGEHGAGDT